MSYGIELFNAASQKVFGMDARGFLFLEALSIPASTTSSKSYPEYPGRVIFAAISLQTPIDFAGMTFTEFENNGANVPVMIDVTVNGSGVYTINYSTGNIPGVIWVYIK